MSSLALLAEHDSRALPTAARVLEWTLIHMQRRDGRYAFQQHRAWRNSIPYIRWGDAHVLNGLAVYSSVIEGLGGDS